VFTSTVIPETMMMCEVYEIGLLVTKVCADSKVDLHVSIEFRRSIKAPTMN